MTTSGACGGITDTETLGLNNPVGPLLATNPSDAFPSPCDIVYVYKMSDGKAGDDSKVLSEGKGSKASVHRENGRCDAINLCVLAKIFVDSKGSKTCINNSLTNTVVPKAPGVNLTLTLPVEAHIGSEMCITDV